MKKRQIRKFLIAWGIVYLITIFASLMFPSALDVKHLNQATQEGSYFKMNQCLEMNPALHDYFELSANIVIEPLKVIILFLREINTIYKKTYKQNIGNNNQKIAVFDVSYFNTKSEYLYNQCELPTKSNNKIYQSHQWNSVVDKKLKERKLACTNYKGKNLQCDNIPLVKGEVEDYFQYHGFQIKVEQEQDQFKIQKMEFFLRQRNIEHTSYVTILKYVFVAATILTLTLYYRIIKNFQVDDLGLIQKWIMMLLVVLLFFDDPLCSIKWIFPFKLYYIIHSLAQATFISMLLFFWLILVHSISANELMNVDEKRFFLPKIVLCGLMWFILLISLSYFSLRSSQDPSFHWRDDLGTFYQAIQFFTIMLILIYAGYFVMIAYMGIFQIKEMKKSYRFALLMTLGVICISLFILLCNGYVTSNSDTTLFVSVYALFNIYMYVIAYLYSPSLDILDQQFNQTRKEHEHIMSQFYESELPDITREDEHHNDESNDHLKTKQKAKHRENKNRYKKKDPKEKAKEKLWESIVQETEKDDEEESSDDENQI